MQVQAKSVEDIEHAVKTYGVTSDGSKMIQAETDNANESIVSEMYITWIPNNSAILSSDASHDIKNGTGQCCRVGTVSFCLCGHTLASHKPIIIGRKNSFIRPPTCAQCKRCYGFAYRPNLPEEVGQWWLPRRKDFNITDWRKVSLFLISFVC